MADLGADLDLRGAAGDTQTAAAGDILETVVGVFDIAVAGARSRRSLSSTPQLLSPISSQTRRHHSLASFPPQASADKPEELLTHSTPGLYLRFE